jgi:hypothetical protein
MKLCATEDNGLVGRVDFAEEFFDAVFIALAHSDVAVVEILFGIYFIRVNISLYIIIGVVDICIDIAFGYAHTERREEAVCNTLFEGIAIDRISEIAVGVGIIMTARSGSHTELVCKGEIVHEFAPLALVVGSSAVALVDNDKIKEVGGILFVIWLPCTIVAHESLENGKVQVA